MHEQSLDISEEEFKLYLDPQSSYHPIPFLTPVEMLKELFNGLDSAFTEPWSWQSEVLELLANTPCSNKDPFRLCVSANNGAGKDSMINAPWAVFQAMCKIRSRTICTTASFSQLVTQTEAYIRTIAGRANKWLQANGVEGTKLFVIKKQHIVFVPTGSEIVTFVTDEAGRAEGYHPFPDYPKGELTVMLNEAKTVSDNIFEALSRCTYSRWLEISSPGGMSGKHYSHIRTAVEHPAPYDSSKFYFRRVTSYDCPHISKSKIDSDRDEYGENSALFRSKHLALFTSIDEQVVINKETLDRALLYPCKKLDLGLGRRAGLDLAKGGDENSLYIVEENQIIGRENFVAKDTAEVTIPMLLDFFKRWNLEGENIYADDNGVGGPVIDGLRRAGYPVNRVLNQSPARHKGQYGNMGAELWFRFSQFVPYIIFQPDDKKLLDQLISRYYKHQANTGRIILEAKPDARVNGHGSPDRADALILAYTGVSVHQFLEVLGIEAKSSNVSRKLLSVDEALEVAGKKKLTLPEDVCKLQLPGLINEMRIAEKPVHKGGINNPGRLLRELYK